MAEGETVIVAEGLGRRYRRSRAVENVDLTVRTGEIVGLVGPDGAGKTTLLQLLSAILDPTEGHARVLGFDTVREAAQVTSRIGYMAQGFTLYDRLSVAENLAFAASVRDVPADVFADRRQRLLAMAGLAPFTDRREGALSGVCAKSSPCAPISSTSLRYCCSMSRDWALIPCPGGSCGACSRIAGSRAPRLSLPRRTWTRRSDAIVCSFSMKAVFLRKGRHRICVRWRRATSTASLRSNPRPSRLGCGMCRAFWGWTGGPTRCAWSWRRRPLMRPGWTPIFRARAGQSRQGRAWMTCSSFSVVSRRVMPGSRALRR